MMSHVAGDIVGNSPGEHMVEFISCCGRVEKLAEDIYQV